jgi:hypothetical protein
MISRFASKRLLVCGAAGAMPTTFEVRVSRGFAVQRYGGAQPIRVGEKKGLLSVRARLELRKLRSNLRGSRELA